MSKKVKKGSALITVLVFSLLFVVISGVSTLAVVNTMRGNSGEERYQTLYYEAEAGVERALANADSGDYDTLGDLATSSFTINDSRMIGEVNVNITKHINASGDEYMQVVSTSTVPSGQSRTVKAKIKKYIYANDIFRYSLCGEAVVVDGGGSLNLNPSLINSSDSSAELNGGSIDAGSETNESFELPIFDNTRIPHNTGELLVNNLSDLSSKSCVKIVSVQLTSGINYNVYLVNTDKLKFNLLTGEAFQLNNTMIFCNGEVEIKQTMQGTMTASSIVAKKLKISNTEMQISFRPYDPIHYDGIYGPAFSPGRGGDCPLGKSHLEMLLNGYTDGAGNVINGISYYAPNYSYGGGPSTGGSLSGIISDYE